MTLTLQEATGKNVILLPMGASDDGAHSQEHTIIINIIMQLILTTKTYILKRLDILLIESTNKEKMKVPNVSMQRMHSYNFEYHTFLLNFD